MYSGIYKLDPFGTHLFQFYLLTLLVQLNSEFADDIGTVRCTSCPLKKETRLLFELAYLLAIEHHFRD